MEGMNGRQGKFTGVGVGPGDPELLTLKAVRAIEACGAAAVPVSDPALADPFYAEPAEIGQTEQKYLDGCAAYQIAVQAVPALRGKAVLFLPMPMIKDKKRLKEIHDRDAEKTAEILEEGKRVVFLTLGDPAVYSTCMYVHQRLKQSGYRTELIPGIPSFCAAAARMDIPLVENRQELHILPASYELGESLRLPGTKVLMKSGRKLAQVKEQISGTQEAWMVVNCGMKGEQTYQGAENMPDEAGYYSLLVVKEKKSGGRIG